MPVQDEEKGRREWRNELAAQNAISSLHSEETYKLFSKV
jgi:hypothetical protein